MSIHKDDKMPLEVEALCRQIAEECKIIRRAWSNTATLARFLVLDPGISPLCVKLERLSDLIGDRALYPPIFQRLREGKNQQRPIFFFGARIVAWSQRAQ